MTRLFAWRGLQSFRHLLNIPPHVPTGFLHGTRQPNLAFPVWVTAGVYHGGFATGQASAALEPHESNDEWSTDEGFEKLSALLDSKRYGIEHIEHGALLSAAYLARAGHASEAAKVVSTILPFADRLRFYPTVASSTGRVSVDTNPLATNVTSTQKVLDKLKLKEQRAKKLNSNYHVFHVDVAAPLRARASELLRATLRAGAPTPSVNNKGQLITSTIGDAMPLHCGMDDLWFGRVRLWLDDFNEAAPRLAKSHTNGKATLLSVFHQIAVLVTQPSFVITESLQRRAAFVLGQHLDRIKRKKHETDDGLLKAVYASKLRTSVTAKAFQITALAVRDLDVDLSGGLTSSDVATVMAKLDELKVQPHVVRRVARVLQACHIDTIENLIRDGIINSAEQIGVAADDIVSATSAAIASDPALCCLLRKMNYAFRHRRSVLLMSMESQVNIWEIPWYSSLLTTTCGKTAFGKMWETTGYPVVQALTRTWLRGFPGTIIPNRVVSALRAIQAFEMLGEVKAAHWPFQEELAADIFCGEFSPKFCEAARETAALLTGSLYAKMYHLADAHAVLLTPSSTDDAAKVFFRAIQVTLQSRDRWVEVNRGVTDNGRIIETAQILTLHNLASLLSRCVKGGMTRHSIEGFLGKDLKDVALQIWRDAVVRTLRKQSEHWRLRRQWMKTACYAYRQMIFFVSLMHTDAVRPLELDELLCSMREYASRCAPSSSAALWLHDVEHHFIKPLEAAIRNDPAFDWRLVPLAWFGVKYPGLVLPTDDEPRA